MVSLSIFDYVKSKLPYIVGLHKDAFKAVRRKGFKKFVVNFQYFYQSYNASHENNEKTAEQHNRVVFDIDEGTFLHIFVTYDSTNFYNNNTKKKQTKMT